MRTPANHELRTAAAHLAATSAALRCGCDDCSNCATAIDLSSVEQCLLSVVREKNRKRMEQKKKRKVVLEERIRADRQGVLFYEMTVKSR